MASDWDQRQLCSDGGCVGVIGPDGTCKSCGRAAANWGDERRRGQRTTAEVEPVAADAEDEDDDLEDDEEYVDDGEDGEDGADADQDGEDAEDGADAADDGPAPDPRSPDEVIAAGDGPSDFDGRKLCPDGGCIGVIGDNGKCRVCGKKGV